MVKLIYENGHFFKRKKGKLVEVNKDGIPIVKTDTQLVVTKKIRTKDAINKKFDLSKQQPNFTGEVKGETSLAEEVLDVATTKEGIGTIGGAAVGGWFGSSMGIVALGTGIAGTLPVAIVGGVVGFLMVKAFGDDDKKKK